LFVTPAAPHSSPRLLVADDDEGLLFLMLDALRREGWDVEGFASGGEALEWLHGHSADLLLLDLKLADLSALQLVARLRESGHHFPFIIVTGHGDERTAVEAMKQGALDYVMKDAGMLELLPGVVRRTLAVVERERRLAEADSIIRKREERHEHVIQTALDGFVRFERTGRLLEVNQALCDLLGYAPEELLRKSVFDAHGTAFREEMKNHVGRVEQHGSARCFTRLLRADGTDVEVEISLRCEDDELFGFVHDISTQLRLERELQQITLNERRRFGNELHDGLGQQLTAIELMTHTLARELKSPAPTQAKAAFEITTYIRRAITQTRELAHGLLPIAAEAEGLMNSLQELARMTLLAGKSCDFQCQRAVQIGDSAVASHLYRIAQEAVTNALKHAEAQNIHLRLEDRGAFIELTIEDDGRGLPRRKSSSGGMGLQVMQHRARLIGGHLEIESHPDKGVRIICSLPTQP
jgi:two-component system, LuxR family, sensor kinase FixL